MCVCVCVCVCEREREREREREISSSLSNEAAWLRVEQSREGKKNLSFVCLRIELVTLVKCGEC